MRLIGLVLKKKYQILTLIAENDRFYSFRGIDVRDDSPIFIKVVKSALIKDRERKKIRIFTEEVKSIARLEHENVVKVLDADFKDGILYVVTEWVNGRPLNEYIRNNIRLEFWSVVQIVIQLSDALLSAYEKGIRYRTVKHSNIMISEDMKVKILSFNIPRSLLSPVPVRIKENKGIDPDIFFMGVVLYELLTLKFPFRDREVFITDIDMIDDDVLDTRFNITADHVEDAVLKDKVEKIIYHATTRKILDRYKSMDEFLADIRRLSEKFSEKNCNHTEFDDFGSTEDILTKRKIMKNDVSGKKTVVKPRKIDIDDSGSSEMRNNIIRIVLFLGIIGALFYFVVNLF
ncbi:MAG: serine/threonine-protein kinase [Candidatus Muiribacteriaceae bacterium]